MASVTGKAFVDEAAQDKMYTANEPALEGMEIPLTLQGPDVNREVDGKIGMDGSYAFEGLRAGTYRVLVDLTAEVRDGLEEAGYEFAGDVVGEKLTVAAGGMETVNFPFRITMQTITVEAVMGMADEEIPADRARVADVELELYGTAQDAEDEMNPLSEMAAKTDEMGMASFTFLRDEDTSPAGEETDNIVFVKVKSAGHDDLEVSDNDVIEVSYLGTARVHAAGAAVTLLNVAVNFQFWIKSDKDAQGGDMLVDGWHTDVTMGDSEDPLMMPDPEDDTKMVNLTMPSESSEDEDGDGMPDGMQGRVMVSYRATPDQLPATFNVALRPDNTDATDDIEDWQQPQAMGETWNQVGDNLTYTHTGFELPALNTHDENDLNLKLGQDPARVTFTTQKLTVGVYREADDVAGFSDFQSRVSAGDHRPETEVAKELSVSVMVEASGRRGLEVYDEWDDDRDPDTPAIDATIRGLTGGMATFGNLPADMDFTVQFNEGSDRVAVGGPDSRSDRVQTYGADVELGMSTGAFGDMSGAGPEVELCPLTTDTRPSSLEDDEASDCATFAYQWTTGSITGDVGRAVKDLDVSISADTDEHSEAPRDTETDKDGDFSWSGVQDGVYSIAVTSSEDYTIKEKSVRVDVYHDEFEPNDDEDTDFVGKAGTDHAYFTATKLRLSIKGYAANVEPAGVVRGDDTYEGAELELYAWKNNAKTKIDKTGPLVATATVGADGLYEFNDLDEGDYVIVATNTDDYEMLTTGPDVYYKNKIAAHTYGDADEEELELPYWVYEDSEGMKLSSGPHHLDPDDPKSPTFTFHNFVLLHGDGDFSGRVTEARGEPQGIAVELRRCETYVVDTERCREETDFAAQTDNASSSGRWSFGSLREGWYVANIAATTYNRAKWGDDGIDDDAANCEGGDAAVDECDDDRTVDMSGMLEGNRAFNSGGATFYVYNRTLGDEAKVINLVIEGTTDVNDGDKELANISIETHNDGDEVNLLTDSPEGEVTWASKDITVTPTLMDKRASVRVIVGDVANPDDVGSGGDDDDISVDLESGDNIVTVIGTAENGYNDFTYSFTVTRTDPVDAQLSAMAFGLTRTLANGGFEDDGTTVFDFDVADDEQDVTVEAGEGLADNMSLYIRVTGKPLQQGIEVDHNGDELDALSPRSGQLGTVHDYRITIPRAGDLQGHVVNVTVTSEDGKKFNYEMSLRRN